MSLLTALFFTGLFLLAWRVRWNYAVVYLWVTRAEDVLTWLFFWVAFGLMVICWTGFIWR